MANKEDKNLSSSAWDVLDYPELEDCLAGHKASHWLPGDGWVVAGCKECGYAAAAYKSFEQSGIMWNRFIEATRNKT